MTPAARAASLAVLVAAIAPLAACWRPTADRAHASAADLAACRGRADEVYLKQNRGEIYQADTYATGGRDSPYSTQGLPGITTDGLSGRYHREQLEDDCLNAVDSPAAEVSNPASRMPASDIVRGTALPPPRP
jgi:hypothetical protein